MSFSLLLTSCNNDNSGTVSSQNVNLRYTTLSRFILGEGFFVVRKIWIFLLYDFRVDMFQTLLYLRI
jgi:hypothetical protein